MELFPGFVDPLPEPEAKPVKPDWPVCPKVRDAHIQALDRVLNSKVDYPGGEGKGIVYVGGAKYWPGIAVGIKLIRKMGCNLPIQVWHGHELCDEPVNEKDVNGLDVQFIKTKEVASRLDDARILRGWEVKLYALTHCPFEQFIYLDADAYPVVNPLSLFSLLHPHEPFVFWHDMPHCEGNVKWDWTFPEGKNGVPTVQGGQLIVDRKNAWDALVVAHWMNQHSDYFYRHMFGDQDTWRVALAARASTYRCLGDANWQHPAFVPKLGDRPVFVHRCQGKLFKPEDITSNQRSYSNPAYHLPMEAAVFDFLSEVISERPAVEVFTQIYQRKLWGDGSGAGSNAAERDPYVRTINALALVSGWKSVVDIGCGDGQVASGLHFPDYVGIDCCPDIIQRLRVSQPNKKWIAGDASTMIGSLPGADVLLCKDVLHHWPTKKVVAWIHEVIESKKWKWLVFTQDVHQQHEGQDCHLGGYRALNPNLSPLKEFKFDSYIPYIHKGILIKKIN